MPAPTDTRRCWRPRSACRVRPVDWVPFDACAFRPVPPTSRPHIPTVTGLPKLVVVSATDDPVTPYQGATNLAHALGTTLLTYEGIQHGSFLDGIKGVDEPVLKYLIELTSPQDGLCCPTRYAAVRSPVDNRDFGCA
ncbi:alpha/beta hydrolase [Nocardia sp. R16R-3T]